MFKEVLDRHQKQEEQLEVAAIVIYLLIATPFILAAKALRFGLKVLEHTVISILHFL